MSQEGVCCVCQSVHRVVPKGPTDENVEDDFSLSLLDEEDCFDFVMCSHNFPDTNMHCEGSGTGPQALVVEE